jgi:hypothetical protein
VSRAEALPRVRTRRKRIRPPHPVWYLAVAVILISLYAIVNDVTHLLGPSRVPSDALLALVSACWVFCWWPPFTHPYEPPPVDPRWWLAGISLLFPSMILVVLGW